MKVLINLAFAALALLVNPNASFAQSPYSSCAWPIEGTPEGFGNIALPDDYARYWIMPFGPQWVQMTIKGTYPNTRYLSFVAYDGEVPTAVAGRLFDAQISPDPDSTNPFVPPSNPFADEPNSPGGTYTIVVTRGQSTGNNMITVSSDFAWLILRLYLPNRDENSTGGVPLPNVTLTDQNGEVHPLKTCQRVNLVSDVETFLNTILPAGFDSHGNGVTPPTDRLWFAAPQTPPIRLFPNPDNKYILETPGPFQPGRIVVIRGKAPDFPDTYDGRPVWRQVRGIDDVQTRYWSLCQNDFASPFPVVRCTADLTTRLDEDGFYTIVISDDQIAPDWLPADATWLPWGDEQLPKIMFFRNMLPAANFPHAIQTAIDAGCTFPLDFPNFPSSDEVEQAGRCAQAVMGDYYPVAVWCDKSTFIKGGWQACLRGQ